VTSVQIETIPVGPLACNCTILVDGAGEAIVVDPGDESGGLLERLTVLKARPRLLVLTHAHFDHFAAARAIAEATGASIALHREDESLYGMLVEQGRLFGFLFEEPRPVDRHLEDGDLLAAGNVELSVIHTPGHSPGSVCFLYGGEKPILFSGDTLFLESIGRTDLWGGSSEVLSKSIHDRLFVLPDDLSVIPGHGAPTTIGHERRANPFVGGGRRFW
jgi:hydroxyacylglutathione hydrolase